MKNIWIYAEKTKTGINRVFYELCGKARQVWPDSEITAVILGDDNSAAAASLKNSGADSILSGEHPKLAVYHPDFFAKALASLVRSGAPDIVLIGATEAGGELAPSVSAMLETGLAAHCVDISSDENGDMVAVIPAFGGKLLGEIMIPEKRPAMATVRPGVFAESSADGEGDGTREAVVVKGDVSVLDDLESEIRIVKAAGKELSGRDLTTADTIVCAGLGIGSKENWEKAKRLAAALGAGFGYTRPMVDMGYAEDESGMIGTSGKTVRPDLYIGIGVSGATHHTCGMEGAKKIIAVNTDENAPIFKVSDYKLVDDSGKVLDELLEMLDN